MKQNLIIKNLQRDDIYLLRAHGLLSESQVKQLLAGHVYKQRSDWRQFLLLLFAVLGVGFAVAGIVFFFAYNWASLNKFVKLGLTQVLVLAAITPVLLGKGGTLLRRVLLLAASVLVGVMFAVYGQIYQTGANAYDFFLGWSVFVALWALASNFAPLWLLWVLLLNTTLYFYGQQVANHWSEVLLYTLLFLINVAAIAGTMLRPPRQVPAWFLYTLSLLAVGWATLGNLYGIFSRFQPEFALLLVLTVVAYAAGFWYGRRRKSLFFIAIIPFSLIVIISAFLLEASQNMGMFLLVSLFIISSVTLLIRTILSLQKKWSYAQ